MKQFNVSALGMEELTTQEMKNSNGGFWWWLVGVVVSTAIYCYENWNELQDACQDAKNDYAADNL